MKKIITLLLALCLLTVALTACNGGGSDKTTTTQNATNDAYTVEIVDNEGNPIAGAKLMITNNTDVFKTLETGADGKASADVSGTGLGVMIISVPKGYTKPETLAGSTLHASFDASKKVTVTVQKEVEEKETYTVKVVDQNGNKIEGVELQLCPGGVCLPDKFVTDANGEVTKELSPDLSVDVKVMEVPDGYSAPEALDNGYHALIEAGSYEITITIAKN